MISTSVLLSNVHEIHNEGPIGHKKSLWDCAWALELYWPPRFVPRKQVGKWASNHEKNTYAACDISNARYKYS
jgi:hypothetical protein